MLFSKNQQKKVRYFIEYILALPFIFIVKKLPLRLKTVAGKFLGRFLMYPILKFFIRDRFNIIKKNLQIVHNKKFFQKQLNIMVKDYCQNIATIFTEGFGQKQMTKQWLEENVSTKNLEVLVKLVKDGKKVIIPSAHIGNWEIAHKYLYEVCGIKVSIIYRKQNNEILDYAYVKERSHVDLIEKRDPASLKKMLKSLNANRVIVILLDQRVATGEKIQFFGKDAKFSTAISRLAIKNEVVLCCGYCKRTLNQIKPFSLVFEDGIDAKKENCATKLTQKTFNKFEKWIKESPTQWFCLIQDIWRK